MISEKQIIYKRKQFLTIRNWHSNARHVTLLRDNVTSEFISNFRLRDSEFGFPN